MVQRMFDRPPKRRSQLVRRSRLIGAARAWLCSGMAALSICLAIALMPTQADAQETGAVLGLVVTDATGTPLSGVQVYIPGTGIGALTNQRGRFTFNVPPGTHEIRAERLGMETVSQTVTVAAGGEVDITIRLTERPLLLDEVVVTGTAGQARRREVGSSISQLDMTDVSEPMASVDNVLAGRSPGVISMRSSGAAGSGAQIRLRGNVSAAMSNQPLIYIDGVRIRSDALALNHAVGHHTAFGPKEVVGPLNDINPNDIARIEIVKGPAATALYGTEAAGGVIQIFTVRGAQGRAMWSAQVDQGVNWVQPFGPEWEPYNRMENFLRNAHQQRYSVSVRGGADVLNYFVSGSIDANQGVMPNDFEDKVLLRGNFGFQPLSDLSLDLNTSITRTLVESTPGGSSPYSIPMNVVNRAPATDSTAERNANYVGSTSEEVLRRLLDYQIDTRVDRIVAGLTATYSPTSALTNRVTFGLDRISSDMLNIRPFGYVNHPQGAVSNRKWTAQSLTVDYVGTYEMRLNPAFRMSFSWGGQTVNNEERDLGASGDFLPGPGEHTVNSGSTIIASEARQRVINAGVFAQTLFDLQDRYFLTLALRVDGNSAFGSGFGLQPYPRATVSYVMSDESFWSDGWGELKLRSAYGHAGRAPGAFDAVRTWTTRPWLQGTAFSPQNVGNPDLGPERTVETEAGFDWSSSDARYTLGFTYYNQRTKDALIPVSQVPSQGFVGSQLENVGELSNRGIEVSLDAIVLQSSAFSWNVGLGVYTNRSRVEEMGGLTGIGVSGGGWMEVGQPLPVVRHDKVLNPDALAEPEIERNHLYGPNQPTHTFMASTSFELPNGIQLSARGEYQGGHYIFDRAGSQAAVRSQVTPLCDPILPKLTRGERDQLTAFDRYLCTGDYNVNLVYPADFFRLRDVSLHVPIPFQVPGASSASMTASLQNAWTWLNDDFLQMDPEIAGNEGMASGLTRQIWEQAPPPASFRFSLRMVF